jgi:hypothetical protein
LNTLGDVVTEWQDGPPPARFTDLCGVVQADVFAQVAYTHPADQVAEGVAVSRELRSVLAMILNALDRDAVEGKQARGEMAEELRALMNGGQESDRYADPSYCRALEQERDFLRQDRDSWSLKWDKAIRRGATLEAQRDAILLQAQCWAGEAKAQQSITREVGEILGGIPDWGPIAESVAGVVEERQRIEGEFTQLREAIQQALKSGRGTSGRIILDASDEAALRAALSTANGEVTE